MAAATPSPTPPGSLKRIVAASLIGTTIEWYDNSSGQSYDLPVYCYCPPKSSTKPARGNPVLDARRSHVRPPIGEPATDTKSDYSP